MPRLPAAFLLIALAAPAAAQSGISGRWLTEGGKSQVEIAPCGDQFCGRIVSLREPNDPQGRPKTDKNNPDAKQRARPVVGIAMLWNFRQTSSTTWEEGRIYNPEDGETYRCNLTLQADGSLRVRGYVGIPALGKTQIWTRAK